MIKGYQWGPYRAIILPCLFPGGAPVGLISWYAMVCYEPVEGRAGQPAWWEGGVGPPAKGREDRRAGCPQRILVNWICSARETPMGGSLNAQIGLTNSPQTHLFTKWMSTSATTVVLLGVSVLNVQATQRTKHFCRKHDTETNTWASYGIAPMWTPW